MRTGRLSLPFSFYEWCSLLLIKLLIRTMPFLDKLKSLFGKKVGKIEVQPIQPLKPKPAKPIQTNQEPQKPKPTTLPEVTITPEPVEDFSGVVVMLDNGHGEDTPGKCSPDKSIREYAYVREIVAMIKEQLESLGIEYYIVVPEKRDVKLTTRVNRSKKKYNEAIAAGKKAIFISVHLNAAKNGIWYSACGWSAWTDKGQDGGDILADCLYEAAHEVLDPKKIKIRTDKSDGDADWESNFTVIYNTPYPAVLVENFFQDNKEDVAYLLSDEGKEDIVKIHVEGIKKWIRKYGK